MLLHTHFTLPFVFTYLLLILTIPTIYLSFCNPFLLVHRPYISTTHPFSTSYPSLESWNVFQYPLFSSRNSTLSNQVFYSNTLNAASWYKVDLISIKAFLPCKMSTMQEGRVGKVSARYSGLVFHSPNSVRSLFIVFCDTILTGLTIISWSKQCIHVRFMNREIGNNCRFFEWAIAWDD